LNISVWMSSQKYNAVPLLFRTNASDLYLFKTTNKKELQTVKDEFFLEEEELRDLWKKVYIDKHDFLKVDIPGNKFYRNFNLLEKGSKNPEVSCDPCEKEEEP
jgi:hypothetical protein